MTMETRIQQETQRYRDVDVAAMTEPQVRAAALAQGISGSETTPLVTLREEVAQQYRNDMRAYSYPSRQLSVDATGGNPGNDNVDITP
jgi:hypothetical protein